MSCSINCVLPAGKSVINTCTIEKLSSGIKEKIEGRDKKNRHGARGGGGAGMLIGVRLIGVRLRIISSRRISSCRNTTAKKEYNVAMITNQISWGK